jgi:signal transduction histidine kinase
MKVKVKARSLQTGMHAVSAMPVGHGLGGVLSKPAGLRLAPGARGDDSRRAWPVSAAPIDRTLLMVAGLPLLTQIVGSLFNIWYNSFHVTPFLDAAQLSIFERSIFIFNVGIYPVSVSIWLTAVAWLRKPLVQLAAGEKVDPVRLAKAQRHAVHLPWWFLAITASGWLLCIPGLLIPLIIGDTVLDPRVLTHLPISIAIAGLTSVSQGVFVVELTTERWLYNRLFGEKSPSESEGVHPLSLRGRGLLWLVTAAVCPVLSLLLLVLGSDTMVPDRLFAGAVSLLAVTFALVSAWLMSRLLVEPVEQLRMAARSVASGDLSVQIDLLRADEFGPLIQEFNAMIAELREQERLKRQIAERTRELEDTTTQLGAEAAQREQVTNHLRSALGAAEAASTAKTEFLANMSHELRTPLSAILGFAAILQDDGLPNDSRQEFTLSIERSGQHLLAVINDLLDLTSIQSGKLPVSKSDCDSREILGEVVDLMTVTARLKGLDLRCEIDARVPQTIHTDPLRLRQALVNLLGNATKFTDMGSVTVRVAPAGKGRLLRFDIEDTGPGIADDQIERIFEPFVLGDMSATRTHEGTGLGLPISRHLAMLLGGDLQANSTVGIGSVFSLTIDPAGSTTTGSPAEVPAP